MRKFLFSVFSALAGSAFLQYARRIEPFTTDINHISLTLPRLNPAFNGYRIAQISDIHMDGKTMNRSQLQNHVAKINQEKPDLVVITGDFMTRKVQYVMDDLIKPLIQLNPPDGVLAVPGNHDYWTAGSVERVRAVMESANIIDLSNRVHIIERDGASLYIGGVDDVIHRRARLDLVLNDLPPTDCAILLCHEPDFADITSATMRFDLQLSGHTHGGQIRIPLLGALVSPKHGQRYNMGLYQVHDLQLYVNRGLGTVTLPLRFNCPPEVTIFTLQSPK